MLVLNWHTLRRRAWKFLKDPETTIVVGKVHGIAAFAYRVDKTAVEITVDTYKTDLSKAVAHEILHHILDHLWEGKLSYTLYEPFITSLESPFVDGMSEASQRRWRKAIEAKLPKKQRPKKIKG